MSVENQLQPVKEFFMQPCPLCGTKQPMMIRGLWVEGNEKRLYPDMGYSFCNCKDVFFTKWENITEQTEFLNNRRDTIAELKKLYDTVELGLKLNVNIIDPFFCDWNNPHEYTGFDPRRNFILWDMDSFVNECLAVGFQVRGAKRDFVDLYAILQEIPFHQVARHTVLRFGKERINPVQTGKSLVYFADADTNPDPAYRKGMELDWEDIKKFFRGHVKQFVLDLEAARKHGEQ